MQHLSGLLVLFVNDHMILNVGEDFHDCPIHSAKISQLLLFTRTTEPHSIQLVPNIWNTSFLEPSKNFYWLLSCCCLFSTCPQIYIKSESNVQKFHSETIVSLENGGKGTNFCNADWLELNGNRPTVHWVRTELDVGRYMIKHSKNCEFCRGHWPSMPWFKFLNLSEIVNFVTRFA